MSYLAAIWPYIVPFLVVITVLVFVHELGHYLVARWNGVRVEVFSIGFGPELFGWTDKVGTRWKFSLIPLGGYVRMLGDQDESSRPGETFEALSAEERNASLHAKTPWQKIAVSIAGPAANYIFAILVLCVLYATAGQKYLSTEISSVVQDGAAQKAGLQAGDRIVRVDHTPVKTFTDVQTIIRDHPGLPMEIEFIRQEQNLSLVITPDVQELKDGLGRVKKIGALGIARSGVEAFEKLSFGEAVHASFKDTWTLTVGMLEGIWQIVIRERSTEELGGPLRIAKIAGDVAQSGIVNLIWLMALLSINLGLINLFPIPMLDGGHVVFYFAEAIRGKPLSAKVVDFAYRFGLAFIVGLMLLSFWNDLLHLGVVKWVVGLWS